MSDVTPKPEELKQSIGNSLAGRETSVDNSGASTSKKPPVIKIQSQGNELVFKIPPKQTQASTDSSSGGKEVSADKCETSPSKESSPVKIQLQTEGHEQVVQISKLPDTDEITKQSSTEEKEKKIPVAIIEEDEQQELHLPQSKSLTDTERRKRLREKLEQIKNKDRQASASRTSKTMVSSSSLTETLSPPKADAVLQTEQVESAPERSFLSRAAPWIKLGIILIVVLILGLIFIKLRADEKRRQRERYLFVKQEMGIVDGIYSNMVASKIRISQIATKAKNYADEAQKMLFAVLKEKIVLEDTDVDETSDFFFQLRRPLPSTLSPQPSPTATSRESSSLSDEKLPAGLLSKKDLESMRDVRPAVASSTNITPVTSPAYKAPPKKEKPPEPPIKRLTRQVLIDARVIERDAQTVSSLISEAETARSEAFLYHDPAMLQRCHTKFDGDLRYIAETETHLKETFANIESNCMEIATIKQNFEIEERKRKQLEEEIRLQRERRALIEREQNLVKTDQMHASSLLKEDKCPEAIKYLEGRVGQYKTEEANQQLTILIERYEKIAKLKELLAECINSEPFRWGWGYGSSARDVIKAGDTGITIRGGEVVAWNKVGLPQLTRFVDHYISSKKKEKKLLGELALAFGLYCYENNEPDKAYDYADRAGVLHPALTPDILKLLPRKR